VSLTRSEIGDRVRAIVGEALDRPAAEVRDEASLIDDLGAESIDFLDLVFRLESAFGIKIPEEQIWAGSLGLAGASDAEIQEGVRKLRAELPGFRWDRFPGRVASQDLPRLLTVRTIVDYLERVLPGGEKAENALP
jgi:acyl carrier protein